MNRIQKKCCIAATGTHLLLVLILFFGPGFLSSSSKPDSTRDINFIPVRTIDEAFSHSAGNPNAGQVPSQPHQAVRQPQSAPPAPQPPERIQPPDSPKPV